MTHADENDAPRLANACACGDCYHPAFGRVGDGDPFWNFCRDCACRKGDHTRTTSVIPPATTEESSDD